MTGDPPLLFSRSWRRNFKDPHRDQKHSLGPLIITTGVPLFGRGALSRVQNCSAGVPRVESPYLLLSASFFSRPPPCVYPPVLPQSGRSTHKYLLLPFTSSPRFDRRLSIFSCAPRHGNGRVRGIIKSFDETRTTRYSRLTSRSSRSSVELRSRDRYVRPLVGVKRIVPNRCDCRSPRVRFASPV